MKVFTAVALSLCCAALAAAKEEAVVLKNSRMEVCARGLGLRVGTCCCRRCRPTPRPCGKAL